MRLCFVRSWWFFRIPLLKSSRIFSITLLPPICFQIDPQHNTTQEQRQSCRACSHVGKHSILLAYVHNNTHNTTHVQRTYKDAFSHACKWYNEPGYICRYVYNVYYVCSYHQHYRLHHRQQHISRALTCAGGMSNKTPYPVHTDSIALDLPRCCKYTAYIVPCGLTKCIIPKSLHSSTAQMTAVAAAAAVFCPFHV